MLNNAARASALMLAISSCAYALASPPDVARDARYSTTPAPNYARTATIEGNELTDGRHATGNFWESAATLGWSGARVITIDMQLPHEVAIDRICLRSAVGEHAGVELPRRVDVFGSSNGRTYRYLGDIAASLHKRRGAYAVHSICGSTIVAPVSELRISVEASGKFFFADELEVFAADVDRAPVSQRLEEAIPRSQLDAARTRIVAGESELRRLQQQWAAFTATPGLNPNPADHEQLLRRRREALASQAGETIVAVQWDPWRDFVGTEPNVLRRTDSSQLPQSPLGGTIVLAAVVTNMQRTSANLAPRINWPAGGATKARLYRAEAVLDVDDRLVTDALLPLADTTVSLRPGESQQLWLSVDTTGLAAGRHRVELALNARDVSSGESVGVPFEFEVAPVALERASLPAATVWSYMNDRLVRGIEAAALWDLHEHHINVQVLHPAELPWPLEPRVDEKSRQQFRRRLALGQFNHDSLLLFLALNLPAWQKRSSKEEFLGEAWRAGYRAWLQQRLIDFEDAGIDASRVMIYPVDEPRDPQAIEALVVVAEETRRIAPQVRLYTTMDQPRSAALQRVSRWLDVVQLRADRSDAGDVQRWRRNGQEVWLYMAEGGGKSAPALGFYRALCWQAYLSGASGVGFWSYSDIGAAGTEWSDRDGQRQDYAVIYRTAGDTGSHQIASSKRWEAWRLGLEDLALLRLAVRDDEPARAQAIASSLLANASLGGSYEAARRALLTLLSTPSSRQNPG